MRRTHASLSRQAGIDPKLVADQLGHGLGVNLDVYTVAALDKFCPGLEPSAGTPQRDASFILLIRVVRRVPLRETLPELRGPAKRGFPALTRLCVSSVAHRNVPDTREWRTSGRAAAPRAVAPIVPHWICSQLRLDD